MCARLEARRETGQMDAPVQAGFSLPLVSSGASRVPPCWPCLWKRCSASLGVTFPGPPSASHHLPAAPVASPIALFPLPSLSFGYRLALEHGLCSCLVAQVQPRPLCWLSSHKPSGQVLPSSRKSSAFYFFQAMDSSPSLYCLRRFSFSVLKFFLVLN